MEDGAGDRAVAVTVKVRCISEWLATAEEESTHHKFAQLGIPPFPRFVCRILGRPFKTNVVE